MIWTLLRDALASRARQLTGGWPTGMADLARPGPVRSVRHRLLAIALLPTLVILPLLLGATMIRWSGKFDDLLITKVNSDLTVARQYLERILETTNDRITALAASVDFAQRGASDQAMETWRQDLGLDYLYLLDSAGRVLSISPAAGSPPRPEPDATGTAIDILSSATLSALSSEFDQRARLELVPTPNARPTDRAVEDRGMVVQSFIPVKLPDGGRGMLAGGLLLNQNLVFIDTINDLVYRAGSLPEGSQGTATLFLEDVRISTNVRLFEGRRALGTRVSSAVRARVLDEGQTWLDRAFVVNDWYISAYEPIRDRAGARVGMLYVGFLETPFAQAKRLTLWLVGLRVHRCHSPYCAGVPAMGPQRVPPAGKGDRYDGGGRGRQPWRAHGRHGKWERSFARGPQS